RIGARLRLPGFVHQSRMPAAYAAADCLLLPSEREPCALVVTEAMATGLPCIVSDTCGCAVDLVDDSTGATFPAGDLGALQDAVATVAERCRAGHGYADAGGGRIASFAFARASAGLVRACRAVTRPAAAPSPGVL